MYNKKKIFVTGGNGFIGTNLCNCLISRGYDVVSYDMVEKKVDNNVKWIYGDILDSEKLCYSMEGADAVIHLAAMVGVRNCLQNPRLVIETNVKGTDNVIDVCKVNNINNIIFASSSEVYGEGYENITLKEENETSPKSLYGESKLQAEYKLKNYSDQEKAKVSILRYCNIYGPYQRTDFLIPLFISQAEKNIPLTICGSGKQKRCYTYVDDAVEYTVKAVERNCGQMFEIFNISYEKPSTIFDVVNAIESVRGRSLKVCKKEHSELGRDLSCEIINRVISSEKAQRTLQYQSKIDLLNGIRKMYQFYYNNYS